VTDVWSKVKGLKGRDKGSGFVVWDLELWV
jgi:hypothetical protein